MLYLSNFFLVTFMLCGMIYGMILYMGKYWEGKIGEFVELWVVCRNFPCQYSQVHRKCIWAYALTATCMVCQSSPAKYFPCTVSQNSIVLKYNLILTVNMTRRIYTQVVTSEESCYLNYAVKSSWSLFVLFLCMSHIPSHPVSVGPIPSVLHQ